MIVAIDIGNTAVKVGVFDGDRLVATERVESRAVGEHFLPVPHLADADEVVVVSSSPATTAAVLAALGRPARLLGDDVRRAVASSYSDPRELGLDRLAAAWGARVVVRGGAVAVADVGTAITVDALDPTGRFVAVAIAPGLAAASQGLRAAAPHLPLSTADAPPRLPARSTAESLRAGSLLGFAGLVDRLLAEAVRLAGGAAACVLTGGGADLLEPHVATRHVHSPDAVLHGIVALHRAVPA